MTLRTAGIALALLTVFGCTRIDTELAGSTVGAMESGDIDGDGFADLAVSYLGSPNMEDLAVMLGNGDGTFSQIAVDTVGAAATDFALADFNDDGDLDMAGTFVFADGLGETRVYLGDGAGGFTHATTLTGPETPRVIGAGDLNRDGVPDLAVGGRTEDPDGIFPGRVKVFISNGDGSFGPPSEGGDLGRMLAPPNDIELGDFDNSPTFTNVLTSSECCIWVFFIRPPGDITAVGEDHEVDRLRGGTRARGFELAHLNSDGLLDAAVVDERGWIYSMHGGGGTFLGRLTTRRRVRGSPRAVAAGRFGDDAVPDAVIADPDRDVAQLFGGFTVPLPPTDSRPDQHRFGAGFAQAVGADPIDVEIADFNGDDRPDIVTLNEGDASVTVLLNER